MLQVANISPGLFAFWPCLWSSCRVGVLSFCLLICLLSEGFHALEHQKGSRQAFPVSGVHKTFSGWCLYFFGIVFYIKYLIDLECILMLWYLSFVFMGWKRWFSHVLCYLEGLAEVFGVKYQDNNEPLFETSEKKNIVEAKWQKDKMCSKRWV